MRVIDSPATEVGAPNSLLERARAGDHASFDKIIDLYQRPMYSYLGYLVQGPEVADTLTQDVFLAAYLQLRKAPEDLRIDLWLYRLATRRFLKTARWTRRIPGRPWERFGSLLRLSSNRHRNTEAGQLGAAGADEVERLLGHLPPKGRACLVLRECQELSYDEIAKVLDVTRGEVMSLLFSARQGMHRTLAAA